MMFAGGFEVVDYAIPLFRRIDWGMVGVVTALVFCIILFIYGMRKEGLL